MSGFITKACTALALGLPNIARAASYRIGVRLGLNPVCRLQEAVTQGPFFVAPVLPTVVAPAVSGWQTSAQLFSRWPFAITSVPPDWLANPLTGQRMPQPDRPWWRIPDFDPAVGDIKPIWELSRMDWALAFAQRARNGDGDALARLNAWLKDWCLQNPPYFGPNWKCGQEASIRVMHLAMSAMILGQVQQPVDGLLDLVRLHLKRILPTLHYAMAQDNNHGTSEAAALFMGGTWMTELGVAEGAEWARTGRYWLENRAARLIGPQGSFSQYSLNYHRMMLDTFCMTEVWRRHLNLPAFSSLFQERALAATTWLNRMINPVNGEGPNIGANDGARLLQLLDTDYRDYRPTAQLGMVLFGNCRPEFIRKDVDISKERPPTSWPNKFGPTELQDGATLNYALTWLGVALPEQTASQPDNFLADDGGFAILRRGAAMTMLRYPRFCFRPSQADALHLDLWFDGENLLRDAGSYSYNTEAKWFNYFRGTGSHNTVQFDDRDQMPSLSRFLFGNWLKTTFFESLTVDEHFTRFGAGYVDAQLVSHKRCVTLADSYLRVVDEVNGFAKKAVLRWRLMPVDWQVEVSNSGIICKGNISRASLHKSTLENHLNKRFPCDGEPWIHVLNISSTMSITRCEIVQGWESRHYLEKTLLPVLEIEVQSPGIFTTEYRWAL
jgi:hypothetical protein